MKPFSKAGLAVLAIATMLGAGTALGQPAMHHRHGAPGDVAMAIAALKGQLNLNTSQQQMWDSAVAATRSARESGRANFGALHATLAAELAKAEPDLAAVAAAADDAQAKNQSLRKQARDAWLAVYATFSPDQKAVVRDALRTRMQRMEQMRQKFMQRAPQG